MSPAPLQPKRVITGYRYAAVSIRPRSFIGSGDGAHQSVDWEYVSSHITDENIVIVLLRRPTYTETYTEEKMEEPE